MGFRQFNNICSPTGIPSQATLELASQAWDALLVGSCYEMCMVKALFLQTSDHCCL